VFRFKNCVSRIIYLYRLYGLGIFVDILKAPKIYKRTQDDKNVNTINFEELKK
jgi:hypothetical protein